MSQLNPERPSCSWCARAFRTQNDTRVHEDTCPGRLADRAEQERRHLERDLSRSQSCRDDALFEARGEARDREQAEALNEQD